MDEGLDAVLCAKYPAIFAQRHLPEEISGMGRGFECGNGWYRLIDVLCERLQYETDHNGAPQVIAAQVKNKFGSLRFYLESDASDRQKAIIEFSGSLSRHIRDVTD